jgi:hypothetical protein
MNVTQLKLDTHFLAGSTSATYPDVDLVRNINIAYHNTARLIWESADGWQYDDSNASDLPIAKTSLVDNQEDYTLPVAAQRLHRVQVKDSSGNWSLLKQKDIHDFMTATEKEHGGAGMPRWYDMIGRSIILYPTPSSGYVTLSAGLEVFFDRDVTELPATATTTEPGFATPFHRILSTAAAIDFSQDEQQRKFLLEQKARLENGLVRFYGKRNPDYKTAIKPASKKRWRLYR